MSARALMRATDPSVGTNIGKTSVIAVKFAGKERNDDEPPTISESQLAAGYRSLMRDETLAGRQLSRTFRNGELGLQLRIRMVKSLRQKESWLIWRDMVRDFDRSFGTLLQRLSPSLWFRYLKSRRSRYRSPHQSNIVIYELKDNQIKLSNKTAVSGWRFFTRFVAYRTNGLMPSWSSNMSLSTCSASEG